VEAAVDAMIDAGLTLGREDAEREIFEIYQREGIEYQRVFDDLLESRLGEIDPKILAAGIVAYRRAREAALVLYPHVTVTLVELIKRGLRLGVISDAPRREAWLRLCSLNLHHLFDVVVTHEDTGEHKPSQAPFERVLELLGVAPEEALMVGDWPERDVVGAIQVGMRTAFARYGDTFGTVHSGADWDLEDIHQLLDIVGELNAEGGNAG
ncbi:MAG TPA: HAD family hydrolase, partial [Gemmatimonadota bacterium]|nr:HAD family hydrolase [Gemmatimonadota bacterium]